ncbi:MAG: hypothetical protein OSB41_10215, partial [Kiritimatiellae bacterium]|nr:hypothetical protein [Kiritimatiellia bacterium]
MHFNKFGQTYQLQIASEQDILNVLELDESLWVASSAPVTSFRTDSRLLNHIDHDGNGRINTREVKDAILWTQGAFGGLSKVHWGADHITSDAISSASPDGQKILDASAYIHNAQKSEDRNRTTLAQVRGFLSSVRQQVLNGDGAVVPEAAQSDPTKAFIEHIIQLTSGTEDASGKMGVTRKDLATFMNSVHAFLNWRDREHQSEEGQTDVILPLGEKTVAAHALVTRLSAPIEHYFNIVSAIHFRPELRASLASKADETDGDAYAQSDPLCDWLARFPIAEPCDDGELPLEPTAV